MWCIGTLTDEYRRRMYNLLALDAKPLRSDEPVICLDEKSLQLLAHSRAPLPMVPGAPAKQDYEHVRKGTTNMFVAVEPKAGQRFVSVTAQRGKADFVAFVLALLTDTYAAARVAGFSGCPLPFRAAQHRRDTGLFGVTPRSATGSD